MTTPSRDFVHLIGCGWRRHDGSFKREDRHTPSTIEGQRQIITHAYKSALQEKANGASEADQINAFIEHLLEELDNFNQDTE